ncbi:MAG: hypothetical protein WCZ43_05555 [Proteiniphilum sp.]
MRSTLKSSIKSIVFSFVFIPLLMSCVSLSRATVDLSILLDKQILALEQSHIKMIDKYFEEKRYHALGFLDNEWYPEYLKKFFNNEDAEEIWNEIINNPEKKERIYDLQMVVSIIQSEYMAMRDSLLLPLETTRRELLTTVQEEYNTARTMNNAVLNNVVSVNEIQEVRKEYLSKVGNVNSIENTINFYLEKADKILYDIQKGIDKYNEMESKIESIIENLN